MTQAVDGLRGHLILCGYGRVGSTVARELAHAGQRFVVVDINPDSLARAQARRPPRRRWATRPTTTSCGRPGRARARPHHDHRLRREQRLRDALGPRPQPRPVHRRPGEPGRLGGEALQAGADRVVSPYTRAGRQIAELAVRPRVADFIDFALSHGELAFSIEEVEVAAGGPLEGRTVGGPARRDGIFALAVVRGERDYEPNPADDRVLVAGREPHRVGHRGDAARPARARLGARSAPGSPPAGGGAGTGAGAAPASGPRPRPPRSPRR